MALRQPITAGDGWFAGEDKTLTFTIFKADGVTVEDITGWTIRWEVYEHFDSSTPVFTKTAGLTDPTHGVATVTVVSGDTAALVPKAYHHALWRADGGAKTVLSYGPAELLGAPVPS